MLTISNTSVFNFYNAMRGARNPLNSWDRSDSFFDESGNFIFGPNDLDLAKRLVNAGNDHRKFLRQIFVTMDINAPLYWWKEFDTYKIGTVSNSCSTMHKIHAKEFTLDDFSHEHLVPDAVDVLRKTVIALNDARYAFINFENLETELVPELKNKKDIWWQMIQLLPSSYNQLRTITLNYEVLINMYNARKNHKLDEWHTFCDWIETLPYAQDLICFKNEN